MNLQYVQGKPMFTDINRGYKQYDYLTEDTETEVIIIGGGVTGSILGYYFTKANIPSIIIEKERIAYGSTGITTALLQYELDSTARELEAYTSLENIIQSYQLGLKALEEIQKFIDENGNKCRYERKDTLLYTAKKIEAAQMEQEYLIRKQAGIEVELLTEENNPFSFDMKAGVYGKKGGAQLDPYQYTHQLLGVGCKAGLRVYENTEAVDITYLPEKVEVLTSYGYKLKGKKVIVATGYNTDRFTKRSFGIKTVTYNIATKPVSSFEGWFNQVLIRDNEETYNYFRTTHENRILVGGEDIPFEPGIFDEKTAQQKYKVLEQRVKSMFPNIQAIEMDYGYCGAFASTQDNLGFIGQDPAHKHLWYCLGYGANGILFAILGGMMLSNLYQGEEDKHLQLFRVDRFDN